MYCPYFRGKQFELIVLRDNAEFLSNNGIHPIIEPVKSDFAALVRAMNPLNQFNVACTVIINPQAGEEPVISADIKAKLFEDKIKTFDNISIGYILHPESDVRDLIGVLTQFPERSFTIIHYGYTMGNDLSAALEAFDNINMHVFIEGYAGKLYQRHFRKDGVSRILIRDGFTTRRKNAQYPPSEHFSDLHLTYLDESMDGFGDFQIVGDDYSETGGPAYAVAIHLTYLGVEDDMFIYHFLSDQTDSPTNPGGKFREALTKLIKEYNRPKSTIFKSKACLEYVDLFTKKHFPGLGSVKKLSMQHHIELIAAVLKRE
ncbi:sce7725 family protein [bacterium]|nr:sce7725 family protein [bacterium]MBU1063980.1 sce7725 family protein [bacterium]MBU1634727.1 sce7725 family protein [bacterium]MBU1874433.1 sce7725 family protein [bacterium]